MNRNRRLTKPVVFSDANVVVATEHGIAAAWAGEHCAHGMFVFGGRLYRRTWNGKIEESTAEILLKDFVRDVVGR